MDTLLTEDDGYLVNTDSIGSYVVNGFITFDFDGNVIEQNFVQVALVGNDGQPFWSNAGAEIGRMDTRILSNELLTVDPMGNIYVCRPTSDRFGERCDTCPDGYYEYSFENGGVSALRIIVNGNRSFDFTPSERPSLLNKQVMIFSPHFDSVIGNFYLFDNEHFPANVSPHIMVFSMDIDNENNIFLTVTGDMLHNWDGNQVLYKFANSDSLYYITSAEVYSDAFLIKFDPNLRAQFVCSLQFTDDPTHFSKGSNMSSISIDESSNTLFILGGTQRDPLFETTEGVYVMYRGDTIDLRNNLFWLRIDKDDGHLYSYGKARSSVTTGTKGGVKASDLVVANNRVIAQLGYQSELSFRDTTISLNPTYQGSGLMIWDYDGHEIEYLDHQANAPGNRVNILKLVDSSLFVGGMMVSSATFGSFSLPATAGGTAFIAHYTDTAFMTPYVYTDPRTQQYIDWNQDLTFTLTNTPISLTATASSGLPITYYCADTSIAKIEGQTLRLQQAGTTTVTATQEGTNYGFYPAAPVTKTLTITAQEPEGISDIAMTQPKVYPNPTTGMVTIDLGEMQPQASQQRDSNDVNVSLSADGNAFVNYKNPFRQRVNIEYSGQQPITAAYLTDIMGRTEQVELSATGNGRYTLDLTARPHAAYLLTLVTQDGHRHTVRLLKQSEVFGK